MDEQEAERSRAQIEAGGLPVAAERRLTGLAQQGGVFTSDLSVAEFSLLARLGITPLTQVMGSSIFQHGWQNLPVDTWWGYQRNAQNMGLFTSMASGPRAGRNWGLPGDGRAWTRRMSSLSDAFNGARERALQRLLAEAQLAAADAVVGVQINHGGHDFLDAGQVEVTAVGTAVRLPESQRTGAVVITDLSAQEYVQLAAEGYRPVGVVGTTVVMYTASGISQSVVLSSGNGFFSVAGRANQELGDFTQGFHEARQAAVTDIRQQARDLRASGIIGVSFDQDIREREYEDQQDNRHHDLIVTIHVLGTAITEGHPKLARPPVTTILPLRSLKESDAD